MADSIRKVRSWEERTLVYHLINGTVVKRRYYLPVSEVKRVVEN